MEFDGGAQGTAGLLTLESLPGTETPGKCFAGPFFGFLGPADFHRFEVTSPSVTQSFISWPGQQPVTRWLFTEPLGPYNGG